MQRIELAVETDGVFANPFDPQEVDLRVRFSGPDLRQVLVPAFWFQDYDPATLEKLGEPGWRVRFTPPLAGAWQAQAELAGLSSDLLPLAVVDPQPAAGGFNGFIRIHPHNPRYLALENGAGFETFIPLGINMGWGGDDPIADYTRWLDALSAAGGNTIRVWMASWSFGIEWNDTGLGNYTQRLERAYLLDQVFELAKERQVAIELVLLNHGAFSARVNPQWEDNPYHLKNGGMCASPECFASDPQARDYFKRRLRYIAARWGYAPNLLAWEWWNEADWTPIEDGLMADWIAEMTPVLREFDPNPHLISTSYAQSNRIAINSLPEIDFAQVHLYSTSGPAIEMPDLFQQWAAKTPGKPILFAEFGASTAGEERTALDQQGLHLHNGLWAATFSGFASPAMYWWWDSYVDPLQLWPVFQRLDAFLQEVDLAEYTRREAACPDAGDDLCAIGLRLSDSQTIPLALVKSDGLVAWFHDRRHTLTELEKTAALLQLDGDLPAGRVYTPEARQGMRLTVSGLPDGTYRARWYAPLQAAWLAESALTVKGGSVDFPAPDFIGDLALILEKQ